VAKKQKVKTPALYKVLGPAMAIPTGIIVKKTTDQLWVAVRNSPPPKNPGTPGVSWGDAIAWAAFSGVLVAVGRLLAAQGADKLYTALTGKPPANANADSAA
jgi:hypothetical protein